MGVSNTSPAMSRDPYACVGVALATSFQRSQQRLTVFVDCECPDAKRLGQPYFIRKDIFHNVLLRCMVKNAGYPPTIMLRWQRFLIAYALLSPLPPSRVAGVHLSGPQSLRH